MHLLVNINENVTRGGFSFHVEMQILPLTDEYAIWLSLP